MKNINKALAALLAIALVLSMGIVAFADAPATPTGTITIVNAEKGQTYYLFKIFDAEYAEGSDANEGVTYTIPKTDTALIAAIEADKETTPAKGVCPFIIDYYNENGDAVVKHKTGFSTDYGRGWAWNYISTVNASEEDYEYWKYYVEDKDCESGNTVVFTQPYGYYLLKKENGDAITVNTNAPSVLVKDKNPTNPGSPEKEREDVLYQVGDTVPFTLSVMATNFTSAGITGGDSDFQQVTQYKIAGVSTNLEYDAETGMKVELYRTNTDGVFSDKIQEIASTDYTYVADTQTLTIPWATYDETSEKWTSKYESPCWIVVTYNMILTKDVLTRTPASASDSRIHYVATNTATFTYQTDKSTTDQPIDEKTAKVYTAGISIRKLDGANNEKKLSGATFRMYRLTNKTPTPTEQNPNPDVVIVKEWYSFDPSNDEEVNWIVLEDELGRGATLATADNDTGTSEFPGLDEGVYYIVEIDPPTGYDRRTDPVKVEILVDLDKTPKDNVSAPEFVAGQGSDTNVTQTKEKGFEILTTQITNDAGAAMPTTGGIGTTIFYIVGSIMLIGAAVLLVTKKRMGAND